MAICVPAGWVGTICCIYIYFSVFSISSDLVFLWGGMMVVCCLLVFFPWRSRLTATEAPKQKQHLGTPAEDVLQNSMGS